MSEAEEHVKKLNDNLLALEKKPEDKAVIQELMRSSHTLKGSSATMGFIKTGFLTHVMEDIFDDARNDRLEITSEIINVLFETVDILEESVRSVRETNAEKDVEEQANKLKKITGVATEGFGKSIKKAETKPVPEVTSPIDATLAVARANSAVTHIKVPVERLDNLLALTEELVTDKMRLAEMAKGKPDLEALSTHMERLVKDLQFQVMQSRMLPVEQVFGRFPRLVRDLSAQMKKTIDLNISGNEIELDRTIVDKLGEPLLHLLRNAVDHGIASAGVIQLSAAREKDFVVITVEDDGTGINYEKVRVAAIERNIVSAAQAKEMNRAELINLLYHPQLSTKEEVTETSGRGIGLNVVKEFVEQNGGRITVLSPVAKGGTRFTMELPLSLAIIHSLLAEVSGTIFAIPFSVIDRSVKIHPSNVKKVLDNDVAVVDGTDVPLVYLHHLVKRPDEKPKTPEVKEIPKDLPRLTVLVRRGTEVVGLVVDTLHDELEITVKPLPSVLRKTKGFSGSTILGNGKTILIIDALSLLDDASKMTRIYKSKETDNT